ncbi:TIGR02678 family protein [Nocardiopsis lambiniae]|uniref:TIGR02678 family protein n=1 Tax=Nocardiopsis lambiniae TaxID=3075539 RepID=A0ABU2MF93_9ACTN|nr:TIGR02678 family protein [Nocardiopsis sp. DSM 44743]MDT0331369.1 TIGR02678 family protein [Nocardiopsis sp. DSM 44743]
METDIHSEDTALIGERQAAARALMARPLLTERAHSAEFSLVRSHAEWLAQRFHRVLGYRLTVADDHARLVKRGPGAPAPLARTTGAPFTPRTHTYLALVLAVLVEDTGPIGVRDLAVRLREAAREAGIDADPGRGLGERRAYCAALELLVELGALAETEGSIGDHRADATADARLLPHTRVARSVAVHLPRAGDDPDSFLAAASVSDPDGDNQGELALRRLLAETAVVYREDLPDRQRDRLSAHQWRAAAALSNLLGCDVEVRAEGVALILPDEAVAGLPSDDPVGQVALSLIRHLSGRLHPGRPLTSVTVPDRELDAALEAFCGADAPERAEWARTAGPEIPDPERLRGRALTLLADLGLLRGGPGRWRLTAAAARYGAEADDRVPRIQDNDHDSRTQPSQASGSGQEDGTPESPIDPRGDLNRVASVLQAVANEKVSATSGDPGDRNGDG